MAQFKNKGRDVDDSRRRRVEKTVELRRTVREERFEKHRHGHDALTDDEAGGAGAAMVRRCRRRAALRGALTRGGA